MKAGSMNALIGASTNAKLTDVPMRAYREAELKGNKAGMERAMGYMRDFTEKSVKYGKEAQAALSKEQREEAKELEAKREEAIAKKREAEKTAAKAAEKPGDTLELSSEGKAVISASEGIPLQGAAEIYTCSTETKPLELPEPVIDIKA